MSNRRTMATIPEPTEDVRSLRSSVMALKELVEVMTAQRGHRDEAAVTWGDLPTASTEPVEGVWTPTMIPSSGAYGGITYDPGFCYGRFWKHGKKVDIWFELSWTGWSIGSAVAGQLANIGTLPFNGGVLPPSGYWPGVNISYSSGSAQMPSSGLIIGGGSQINLYWLSGAQSTNFLNSHMPAAGNIWGSASYLTEQ